jgi:hypothetical protein
MDFWTALFLFLAGVFSHQLGNYLFMQAKKVLFYNDVALGSLRIFKFVVESAEIMHKFKYEEMEKNKVSKEEIEKEKDNDRKMLLVWKEVAITGIKQLLPANMQNLLRFNNWEEAMRLLTNRDKKE